MVRLQIRLFKTCQSHETVKTKPQMNSEEIRLPPEKNNRAYTELIVIGPQLMQTQSILIKQNDTV
jgi:hypothetical protein